MQNTINSSFNFREEKNKIYLTLPNKQITDGIKLSNQGNITLSALDTRGTPKIWSLDQKSYQKWFRKVVYSENLNEEYKTIDETANAILKPESSLNMLEEIKKSLLSPPITRDQTPLVTSLSKSQSETLGKAIQFTQSGKAKQEPFGIKYSTDYTIQKGSRQWVITLRELPRQVFKIKIKDGFTPDEAKEIIKLYEDGRKLCQEHQLTRLYVPYVSAIEFEGVQVVVQEKLDVLGKPDVYYQRDLFKAISEHPDLRSIYEIVILELARFIPLFYFSDVKWDNTPFMKNSGSIALYDLDRFDKSHAQFWGIFTGATKDQIIEDARSGNIRSYHAGLCAYLSDEPLLEKIHTIISQLAHDKKAYLNAWNIHSEKIREKIKKSFNKRQQIKKFHSENSIKSIEQPISNEGLNEFQAYIVELINNDKNVKTPDIIQGRRGFLSREGARQCMDDEAIEKLLNELCEKKKIATHNNKKNKPIITLYS